MSETCNGCAYLDADCSRLICHVGKDERIIAVPTGCGKWREGFWHKAMDHPLFAEDDD